MLDAFLVSYYATNQILGSHLPTLPTLFCVPWTASYLALDD